MKRGMIVTVVYLVALALIAPLMAFAVLVVAGPHSGLLPATLEPVAALLALAVALVLPALIARAAWRRSRSRR